MERPHEQLRGGHSGFFDLPLALARISAAKGETADLKKHYAAVVKADKNDELGPDQRYTRGTLAAAAGEPDVALDHFRIAADFDERAGAVVRLAWIRYDTACVYMQLGDPSSLERAREGLEAAREIADRLGMVTLRRFIDERNTELEELSLRTGTTDARNDSQSRHDKQIRNPAGLTSREAEVLSHLAAGKTNQEIAEDLYISEKTVHSHLINVYAKLGVGNRTEAARAAADLGIEPTDLHRCHPKAQGV
jgi:DNA-binding CsgD family transcriptional regulator